MYIALNIQVFAGNSNGVINQYFEGKIRRSEIKETQYMARKKKILKSKKRD